VGEGVWTWMKVNEGVWKWMKVSVRGKRFCGVREQRIAPFSAQAKRQKSRSSSFFATKPHGNACCAG